MSDLLEHLKRLPVGRGGVRAGERIVVGLSGGADSVALTGLLRELDVRIVAAHLDHGLRPDSADDLEFCREFAHSLGLRCSTARADVRGLAARSGLGTEAAGRRLRHAWLEKVRRHFDCDRIALAHHLDDHVETLLMWLGRGTGLSGLTGIPPARGHILRPLREVRRQALRAECERRGWPWREDPTNARPVTPRNHLRAEVLPALEEILGDGSIERMGAMSARASAEREALEQFAAGFVDRTRIRGVPDGLEVARAAWQESPEPVVFQALREVVRRLDLAGAHQRWNEARYRDVLEVIRGGRNGQQADLPGGGHLEFTRDGILFRNGRKGPETAPDRHFELESRILTAPPADTTFWGPERACFDADRLTPPFNLRKVRPGDRMQPFGMSGRKKLSRLMADKAVARHDRWSSLVVEDQERIVWAVGLTTSEHTRITGETRRVMELSLRTRTTDGKGPRP